MEEFLHFSFHKFCLFVPNNQSCILQRIGPAATDEDGTSGGPPPVSQTVVLDTGSDVPWVDCVPCALAECPYYDPARSSTYAAVPCGSPACDQLGRLYTGGCADGQCQ